MKIHGDIPNFVIIASVNNNGDKLVTGVNNPQDKSVNNLLPMSLTLQWSGLVLFSHRLHDTGDNYRQ